MTSVAVLTSFTEFGLFSPRSHRIDLATDGGWREFLGS